jgi:hypothetical protein
MTAAERPGRPGTETGGGNGVEYPQSALTPVGQPKSPTRREIRPARRMDPGAGLLRERGRVPSGSVHGSGGMA